MTRLIPGTIYSSNFNGNLTIVSDNGPRSVLVAFVDTGYKTTSSRRRIKEGIVKDRLRPSVCGVGFVGDGRHVVSIKSKHTRAYMIWHSMLQRCYSPKSHAKRPTYIGCSVAKEWHCFQVFAAWFEKHHRPGLHLDKDIKIKGNKVYGPDTCMFVSQAENTIHSCARRYKLISPEGLIVDIYNMSEFAKDNGLSSGHMCAVANGSEDQYRGWTRPQHLTKKAAIEARELAIARLSV